MKLEIRFEPDEFPEEAELQKTLAELQRRYSEEARPILDRLAHLQGLKKPVYLLVPEPGDKAEPHVARILRDLDAEKTPPV